MIFYNSLLARWLFGNERHYFMIGGICFTRHKKLEEWEEMELRIHVRQYCECVLLMLLPALILSTWSSWWMLLPFATYHLLYWLERTFRPHSVFDWEAIENSGDTLYLSKRKLFAWMRWYGSKTLPLSDWDE